MNMRGTVALLALVLTGCSTVETLNKSEEQAAVMGNATPAASPDANPDGKTQKIGASDIAIAGTTVASRDKTTLRFGSLNDLSATELTIDSECGELTATDNTFVLPCAEKVFLIDAANPTLDTSVSGDKPFTTAVLTSNGTIIAGGSDRGDVTIFSNNETKTLALGRRSDQLVRTPSDSIAVVDREQTSIQGVLWQKPEPGAALRVGLGVGKVAPGDNDVVFAADTTADQLAVYTLDSVIRLHQTAPVADSPWDLAWDPTNDVVWVASTGTNTITAYGIETGVPEAKGTLKTISNVRSVEFGADGTLLIGSETELQTIDADTVKNALK